jgi:hypothetical protein
MISNLVLGANLVVGANHRKVGVAKAGLRQTGHGIRTLHGYVSYFLHDSPRPP